jgi:hypothetical protein
MCKGVPASRSGYSAEPEPISVVSAADAVSIPNAAIVERTCALLESMADIRGAETLEKHAKRTRSKSYRAALTVAATYLRVRAGQVSALDTAKTERTGA